MMDALLRLFQEGASCCSFHNFITDQPPDADVALPENNLDELESALDDDEHLNPGQLEAVRLCGAPLSLIWGPPGS
jgi:hypothetical protein